MVTKMKTEDYQITIQETKETISIAQTTRDLEETCKNCHPLTPLTCMSNCKIWKLKNEFKNLNKKMEKPDFFSNLLNTLKNSRRIKILGILSNSSHSITSLQEELKKHGYVHSQKTIIKEYISPMMQVGLIENNQKRYHVTMFGCHIYAICKSFENIEKTLPPHSKCHEETALMTLFEKPKTHKELKEMLSIKSLERLLNRLQKAKLVETTRENDYVFYFKTKRDQKKASFSPTERRVYENIPAEGISARQLVEKTHISLRRAYKYLRRLKGKKLVFARKKSKEYVLTAQGYDLVLVLKKIQSLISEVSLATEFKQRS